LEQRCLLAASPFPHYDMGTPTLADLWVDPTSGNDVNSGATRDQAVRTLTEAWNRIPNGAALDTTGYRIQLVSGQYTEDAMPTWWDDRHGTFEHPIIIQAADGPGTVTLAGMDVHNVDYMYLIGLRLEVRGGGGNVLHFASSDHVLIRDSVLVGLGDIAVSDAPQETLKVNQSHYVFLEDSDVSGASWTAVDYVAVQHGHVIGSKIHRAGDWAMYFKGGSAYLRVEGNELYDASTGGFSAGQGTGFEFMVAPWLHYETYDVKFVNNVIHDTEGAGIGVNGSYNVLMAYNTMYRVGRRSHVIEVVHGHRSCDGNAAQCRANLAAGGWGTATPGREELIPNKHVYIYNNIVYNPAGYQSQWQQFAIADPAAPSPGSNIPNPTRADDDLQIRGNILWNGPADLPLGIEGQDLSVTEAQLRADNAINTFEPELIDPVHGDFRPTPGSNVFSATTYNPPDFGWSDAPAPPSVPPGDPSNVVTNDRAGGPRTAPSTPGAYAGPAEAQDIFFLHQSVGQGIMDDHGGHPGLVSQVEAAGHHFSDWNLWDSPPGGSIPTEIASLFADQNGDGTYGDLLGQIPGVSQSDVLMLKSCYYTLSELEDPANLANWEQAFIDSVAPYANQHPEQKLVVMPAVPERRSSGLSAAAAARARDWSEWLAGEFISQYTTQHNVFSFNLFNFLANPESDARNANYQREEYLNSDPGDSHPNNAAYSAAADAIADYLLTTVISPVNDPDPVVEIPNGDGTGSVLVRRRDDRLQVVDQSGGRVLLDRPIARLNSLTVVGSDERADNLTVDLPPGGDTILPAGLRFDGGSGDALDTLTLRGTTGDDTFVLGDGSASLGGLSVSFQGVERLSADGGKGNDTYQIARLSTTTTLVDSKGIDWLDFSQAVEGVTVDLRKSGGQTQSAFAGNANTLGLRGTFENVIGSPQADVILGNSMANQLRGGDGNDRLYGNSGNEILYGGPGDDWLYGDTGNDRLYGESGNNVLLGGSGNDRLDVLLNADAAGRNLLIGGTGLDTLQGGPGEAILIGSTTAYDSRPPVLAAIMGEWMSGRSFEERSTNLTNGITDPVLGLIRLTKRTSASRRGTVLDDGVRDTLFGSGSDWFFSFAKDRV
jgi:Ca2+-binding RTX toxin-like protein